MNQKLFVVISSPVETKSGYGERSRDLIKSLIKIRPEWDIKLLSQRWGMCQFGALDKNDPADQELLKRIVQPQEIQRQPDVWVQITVPNEMQPLGKFNILFTAGTESNPCSAEFLEGINRANLTVVSSKFTKDVFDHCAYDKLDQHTQQKVGELKCEKPVEVLFEGLNPAYHKVEDAKFELLDEIKEDFLFVTTGTWLQGDLNYYADRKGISLSVKMFLETFKNLKNSPGLILKTQGANYSYSDQERILMQIDHIRKSVVAKSLPNIYLLHGHLPDTEMNQLYNHPKVKAFFLPSRGEGFGRPYLEFSAVGKPVIASNYSGQTDFLRQEYTVYICGKVEPIHPSAVVPGILVENSQWFSPDPNQCAQALMSVYDNYQYYEKIGKKQGYISRTEYSMEMMEKRLDEILNQYVPKFSMPVEIKLPTLKNITMPDSLATKKDLVVTEN